MSTLVHSSTRPLDSVVLAVVLTGFVASTYGFGVYLFANLVVDMRRDIGFDYTTVGLITGGAQVGFLLFSSVTSVISRYVEGWKISLVSTVITSLALLGLSVSHSIWLSGGLLILLGGCSASVYIPLAEIVTKGFSPGNRSRVMGLISSGTSYGVFINGLLVSFLTLNGGWRSIWLTAGLISVVLCVMAWLLLRNLAAGGEGEVAAERLASARRPVAWLSRSLYLTWAIAFLNGMALLPFQTYLAPYLRDELGVSVRDAGFIWTTIGAVGMASGFLVGWIADKVGVRVSLAMCFLSAGLASVLVFSFNSIALFYLAALLFALAFYPVFGLVPSYIGQIVPVSRLTQAFGIANVLIGLGGVCGNFLGGLSKDLTGSFSTVYWVVALLLFVQCVMVFMLGNPSVAARESDHE
ncbi:MFS transporter [Pseudomonas fluorescens]|uniref:MFS transporter n=1 Tax=Pseudomonas lactucae TaxID=2813360 RepID=A0A9X0YIE1_9PSED|nr:MFS transporter [Pseudomonas lactucae]OPA94042.1 MFS transporter [Pseudomonas fluorescens]MBN2979502.1 MFS transporter [Pseudomonas lactucae]MBN2986689.1 MFS transporter [Pseudomonas lactucae]OPB12027.1 MFS transporter [Pseudomonas fluorescens]OPB24055.1 MFS transporter [Pseudomonas fluorescens]